MAKGLLPWLARIRWRCGIAVEQPASALDLTIPAAVRERLIADNNADPLFPKFRRFGRGRPGVTREEHEWWVVGDELGRVVGGVRVSDVGSDHPPALDVAVDPKRLRQGFASSLYLALEQAGIDV